MSDPNPSYGLSNAAREGQPWSNSLISNIWDRRIERVTRNVSPSGTT